jgi:hypothetical protein
MRPSEQTFKFKATGHIAEAFMRAHVAHAKVPVCLSLPDGNVTLYGIVAGFEEGTEDDPFTEFEFFIIAS